VPRAKVHGLEFGFESDSGNSTPSPKDLRAACYGILGVVRGEQNRTVKRVLAGLAFALAQHAELASRPETKPKAPLR